MHGEDEDQVSSGRQMDLLFFSSFYFFSRGEEVPFPRQ